MTGIGFSPLALRPILSEWFAFFMYLLDWGYVGCADLCRNEL